MASNPAPDPNAPTTLEGKILLAAAEADQIANIFSPAVGQAVAAGIEIEPVVAALIRGIIGLFHHHTGVYPPAAAQAAK